MKTYYLSIFLLLTMILSSCKSEPKKTDSVDTQKTSEKKEVVKKTAPEQPFVYGIDISSYQGDEVDFINSKKDSIGFIICKAVQGMVVDPDFTQNWAKIKEDGFIRGAYHFYESDEDPIQQSIYFARTIASIESTDLPPIVDFESGGIDQSQSVEEVQKGLLLFINTTIKQLNRIPMIYTDTPTANKYLNDERFAKYSLWIADYNGKTQPEIPETWKSKGWTFWQRDDDYKLDHFTNDSDVFNGDISKLKDFIKNN